MSAPTPGPWTVERLEYPSGLDVSHEVMAAGLTFVCQTFMREILTEGDLIAIDEANARLIAASPAALSVAERTYIAILLLPMGPARLWLQGEMGALRDYIALATGREARDVQDEFEAKAANIRDMGGAPSA